MKTITINGKQYPTYTTLQEADEYFSGQFNSGWDNIPKEEKEKLLVSATRKIDRGQWLGNKKENTQETQFPRIILDKETEDIRLIQACAEEANAIFKSGTTAGANTEGIKSMRVQDTEITYLDNRVAQYYKSDEAYDLLYPYMRKGTRVLY